MGGVEICGGVESKLDDTIGGPGADVGDSETAGAAEARGGVEAESWDDTDWGGVFMAESLTEEAISGR